MSSRSGNARSIDLIDFLKYIVPTLVVEALQHQCHDIIQSENTRRQKRKGKKPIKGPGNDDITGDPIAIQEACSAIQCLSRACCLSEQFTLSQSELVEIDL